MGISLSIAFEKPVSQLGKLGSDHMDLGDNVERLDKLLEKAKLAELLAFVSVEPEALAHLLGLDVDDPSIEPEQWFPAAEGLAAVQEAMNYLRSNATALSGDRDAVLDDLQDVEAELTQAEAERISFHFCLLD